MFTFNLVFFFKFHCLIYSALSQYASKKNSKLTFIGSSGRTGESVCVRVPKDDLFGICGRAGKTQLPGHQGHLGSFCANVPFS